MIDGFNGCFHFLSNFHPSPVEMDGVVYPTVEHAYQAAKTDVPWIRERMMLAKTPAEAKRMGRTFPIRDDWERVKIDVMFGLLQKKFAAPTLRQWLKQTRCEVLVELNTWGDMFWGVVVDSEGIRRGENHLGRLLMQVRDEAWEKDGPMPQDGCTTEDGP